MNQKVLWKVSAIWSCTSRPLIMSPRPNLMEFSSHAIGKDRSQASKAKVPPIPSLRQGIPCPPLLLERTTSKKIFLKVLCWWSSRLGLMSTFFRTLMSLCIIRWLTAAWKTKEGLHSFLLNGFIFSLQTRAIAGEGILPEQKSGWRWCYGGMYQLSISLLTLWVLGNK